MYARGVTRAVNRINSKKSAREAPVAVLSNTCNPTHSVQISRDFFFDSVLPIATYNGWIPKAVSSGFTFDISGGSSFNHPQGAPYEIREGHTVVIFPGISNASLKVNIYYTSVIGDIGEFIALGYNQALIIKNVSGVSTGSVYSLPTSSGLPPNIDVETKELANYIYFSGGIIYCFIIDFYSVSTDNAVNRRLYNRYSTQ